MTLKRLFCVMTFSIAALLGSRLNAQVQTEVPPLISGATPVRVEHIKIHGKSLEGNLEGNAVDREVIVFLPPSYAREKSRRYPVVYALHGYSIGAEQWSREKHSDVFGSLYIMSPCCLSTRSAGSPNSEIAKTLEAVKTTSDLAKLSFFARAQIATAAAWSPNPKNPPLYLDLPTKGGELQHDIIVKWAANAPLAFVDQYLNSLRSYRGIAIDVGDQDGLRIDARKLNEILDAYGIANSFDISGYSHE